MMAPFMDTIGTTELLLALALMCFSAFSQGFSGFGYGIIAMAGLAFFWPDIERASVILTMQGLVLFPLIARLSDRGPGRIDWKLVAWLFPATIVGMPFGYRFILYAGSQPVYRLLFGIALILFSINGFVRPHFSKPLPAWLAPVAGFLGGLISGAMSSGGPPIILFLYSREKDARRAKGTAQTIFSMTCFVRLATVQLGAKPITLDLVRWTALSLPLLIAIIFLAHRLSTKVSSQAFSRVVYTLIGFAGLVNLVKGLLQAGTT